MPARDVFLCHASVDKAEYVNPLAEALARRGVSCWIDEAEIRPGESIIDTISEGLTEARYVVVLITESFIARAWTQKELNAALFREIDTSTVIVLPILVMDRNAYLRRYPLLADKLYMDWNAGVELLATRIADRFGRESSPEWQHLHPAEHVGLVWVRVLPQPGRVGQVHHLTLRWGPYIKHVEFTPEDAVPVSFLHHKMSPDSVLLLASVDPPSIVTFGQGHPPDPKPANIDEGWTRVAGGHWPGHL
ncbi:MAG TPA: toll/interleukin-1 receptor domain-containing protein [Longimicrobium sp.]|jgi:hypothetical protein